MHQALAQAQCSSAENVHLSALPIRLDGIAVTICSKGNQSSDTNSGTACMVPEKHQSGVAANLFADGNIRHDPH